MISVAEAWRAIEKRATGAACRATESRGVAAGSRAVCAEDIATDLDCPPFDRVMMDGIAINARDFDAGCRSFVLCGTVAAGQWPRDLTEPQGAVEVMTGAPLPAGADAVVRYEDLEIKGGRAALHNGVLVRRWQNVHGRGTDARAGDVTVAAGTIMAAPQWAVAAACGYESVRVFREPRVLVVATGDELCDVGQRPSGAQVRVSNCFAVAALLRDHGLPNVTIQRVGDDRAEVAALLRSALDAHELCVFTGAVSAGRYDFLPSLLRDLGIYEVFHGVAQRPGKPLWFGDYSGRCLVFGLPGNPVSALMTARRYVVPCALRLAGYTSVPAECVQLAAPVAMTATAGFARFVPVRLMLSADALGTALPVAMGCSGDLIAPVHSNGFVECAAGPESYQPGTPLPLYRWSAP